MKTLISFILVLNVHFLYSQNRCDYYCLNFKDTLCSNHLIIDTAINNIWQIGRSQKPLFKDTLTNNPVLITDTINPYPIKNKSVFTIKNLASMGDIYGLKMISGGYYVQTDSLHDYGKIEFSPNNGLSWIDIINDTLYNSSFSWYSSKPVLTGRSFGWKYFDFSLADNRSVFNIKLGDTLLFRFTFISDSIFDNLGGLMFKGICFDDFVEGVSDTHFKPMISQLYPNPNNGLFTIAFANPLFETFQLSIYDLHSRLIYSKDGIKDSKVIIDSQQFNSGTFIYKLTCLKAQKRSWGKIVISKY